MSIKNPVYFHNASDAQLYELTSLDDEWVSPAFIQLRNPASFAVNHENADTYLTVEIETKLMDEFARHWCLHRNLLSAGGPVGLEYGSPDCEYD